MQNKKQDKKQNKRKQNQKPNFSGKIKIQTPKRKNTVLHVLLSKNLLFTHFVCLFAGMPVFRFLPEFRFSVSPNLHIFIYFQPIFGCFGSNLCTFSGFPQTFQVFWVGLTGIPGLFFVFVCFCFCLHVFVVCFCLFVFCSRLCTPIYLSDPPGQSGIPWP